MPKFKHGTACGVKYSARAVGFWRRLSLRFFPYLTGDVIRIHLKLKRGLSWWPEAILRIDPPVMSDKPGWEGGPLIPLSDFPFEVEGISVGETWSRTLALKGGISFGQPCDIKCYIDLQRVDGDNVEKCTLYIADIEVVSRGPFLTNTIMWGITTIIAIVAILLHLLC